VGFLTGSYAHHGFVEKHRVKWDDKYAPEGWDKNKQGTPDVVYMELSHDARENIYRQTYAQPVQEASGLRRSGEAVRDRQRRDGGRRAINRRRYRPKSRNSSLELART